MPGLRFITLTGESFISVPIPSLHPALTTNSSSQAIFCVKNTFLQEEHRPLQK